MLHIVDGQSGVDALNRASIPGDRLDWIDVLHDGPLIRGSVEAQRKSRAEFIASQCWDTFEKVQSRFKVRDQQLEQALASEVVIWSSAELFDQLQFLQIADRISEPGAIEMVWLSKPLGYASDDELRAAFKNRIFLNKQALDSAGAGWKALTAPSPEQLAAWEPVGLPFMKSAVLRFLAELPHPKHGLSSTESFILKSLQNKNQRAGQLFREFTQAEAVPFMGDWSFAQRILWLAHSSPSAIEGELETIQCDFRPNQPPFQKQIIKITPFGRELLAGKRKWEEAHAFDRWLGGTHLTSVNLWFWDGEKLSR